MKKLLVVLAVLIGSQVFGAIASWTGVHTGQLLDVYLEDPLVTCSTLTGGVRTDDGAAASVRGMIFTRTDGDGIHVMAFDYSSCGVTVSTMWLLASYGDALSATTLPTLKKVELREYFGLEIGGDKISNPSDFYLVFVTDDWERVPVSERASLWYGWVNLAVNAEGALDVLGSDIALYGNTMMVGVGSIPEPNSAMLVLIGVCALLLNPRRRERGRR